MCRDLDAYAHTVAHDLKNPVAGIIGLSELLIDDSETVDAATRQDYLESLKDAGHMLLDMINELLTLATLRRSEFRPEPVDMLRVVNGALFRLSHLSRSRNADISLDEAFPDTFGHAAWLEDVWSNFLSNAIKYGGNPAVIRCGSECREPGWQRFFVRDNGPGLSAQDQERLFGQFDQLQTPGSQDGHGLGLSIVRRILQKIGGRCGVESRLGQGATFYFDLPLVLPIKS
jgi:two-component system, sensor histidine kinase and response regulator